MPDDTINGAQTAQWPGKAVDDAGQDLVAPIKSFLDELGLLEAPKPKTDADGKPLKGETAGIIDSTVFEVTNQVEKLLKGGGALAFLAGSAGGIVAWLAEETFLAAVVIGGAAVVLAAVAIGLAMVMGSDVRGRAAVTTEHHAARAIVAKAYLEALGPGRVAKAAEAAAAGGKPSVAAGMPLALGTYGPDLKVKTTGGLSGKVEGVKWDDSQGTLLHVAKDWIKLDEVKSFEAADAEESPAEAPSLADELRAALATYGDKLTIKTADGLESTVRGVKWHETKGLRIRLDGDWVDLGDVASFEAPAPPAKPTTPPGP